MVNSPKDYLTDRVAEFRIQFCEEVKNIHDEGTHLEVKQINSPDKLESFLTETIEQSMEVGEKNMGMAILRILEEGDNMPSDLRPILNIRKIIEYIEKKLK